MLDTPKSAEKPFDRDFDERRHRMADPETEGRGVVLAAFVKLQETKRSLQTCQEQRALRRASNIGKREWREYLERWELVCDVYDDVRLPFQRLQALSEPLVRRFVSELLESRAFEERLVFAHRLEMEFLDVLCNGRLALMEYASKLLEHKAWDAVSALVRYVEVFGPEVDLEGLAAKLEATFAVCFEAWRPGCVELRLAKGDDALIQHIEPPFRQDITLLGKLRRSWFGRLYVKRLKHYRVVRSCAIWFWRFGYPFFVNLVVPVVLRGQSTRWRSLVSIVDYVARTEAGARRVLTQPVHVETPVPIVFPEKFRAVLVPPHDHYVFPEIFITTVRHAKVYGGTNLVFAGAEVIHHNLYDFARDYTSEERHGRAAIDPKRQRICWRSPDLEPEYIDSAAVFVDACATNYAHWLTEVMPRIAMFCRETYSADIPLVVNDGLHPNLIESLRLLTGGKRRIITLPIGRAIIVSELFLTSVAGYVPYERRNTRLSGHSHGLFCPIAFAEMRRIFVEATMSLSSRGWPKKLYLRRNSGVRNVINGLEVERAVVARGYTVIEPERLSFVQQVQLFSQAEAVIASTGAAVANIIFCPPGTRISILISCAADTSYWYWQNIAAASGNVVRYVLGQADERASGGIHADFRVDVDDVINSLSSGAEFE